MTDVSDINPGDVDALRAQLAAALVDHAAVVAERDSAVNERAAVVAERDAIRTERDELEARYQRLEALFSELRRAHFGRKSEKIDDKQYNLALEEIETSLAKAQAEAGQKAEDASTPEDTAKDPKKRRRRRRINLSHLPVVEEEILPDNIECKFGHGPMHIIGWDVSDRLDVVPAQFRVIRTRRARLGCRPCEKHGGDEVTGVIQAPAPARLIPGGLPTEALVAHVIVSKFADHLPLYRQAQIMARQRIDIDRATLAHWVGVAAAELQPLHNHLVHQLKESPKLFCDETRCPVLDPGSGKTKTGYLWTLARDDRAWGGTLPPAVAYSYAPGRGAVHAVKLLEGFSGPLQVDGYAAYAKLADPAREGGAITLCNCWSHVRRRFYDVYVGGNSPIASEALARIRFLYGVEDEVRGKPPEVRKAVRQEKSKPVVEALKPWFEASLGKLSRGSRVAEGIRYALNQWDGLLRYLDDGRIEIDSNTIERTFRGPALTRRNSLFAGHDLGAEAWALHASFIETCKLSEVNPQAWYTDVLTKLVNLWPAWRIDELMPWHYRPKRPDPAETPVQAIRDTS